MEGKLAGIVSNPPYIPSDNIPGLQAEVGRHEPRLALDGGLSGMDYLFHICNGAASMLKPGGFFIFEVWIFQYIEFKVQKFESPYYPIYYLLLFSSHWQCYSNNRGWKSTALVHPPSFWLGKEVLKKGPWWSSSFWKFKIFGIHRHLNEHGCKKYQNMDIDDSGSSL